MTAELSPHIILIYSGVLPTNITIKMKVANNENEIC